MKKDTGNILRNKREELGLSIPEVAERTKIRENFISALENNDTDNIPASYYDLFLKKYAAYLELSLPQEEKKAEKSDAILDLLSKSSEERRRSDIIFKTLKRTLLFIYIRRVAVLIAILFLSLFIFSRHIYILLNAGEKTYKSESGVKIITIEGDPGDRISVSVKDSIMLDDDKPDFFTFKILASDSCYVCYYSDTLKVKETMLMPGQSLDLKAESLIEAKLGKSSAVILELEKERVLLDLKEQKNASSFIKVSRSGALRIKRSEKIGEYLKITHGIE
ncbi:MAG TPA: helix-turn-helix domain-containing protein [Clostridiales bacterium]|nr:helix-turn-helix domain-containing protein [Clostridiales bacterium]